LPRRDSDFVRVLIPVIGSTILAAFTVASLPWRVGLRRPYTPFDLSAANSYAPGYALLRDAAAVIPFGGSVVTRTVPYDAMRETYFHRFAISLLPGRRVLPAALYGQFVDPAVWRDAEFLILVGGRPAETPGELLLETAQGSVWRRRPR
jgi:hypothetical protein